MVYLKSLSRKNSITRVYGICISRSLSRRTQPFALQHCSEDQPFVWIQALIYYNKAKNSRARRSEFLNFNVAIENKVME